MSDDAISDDPASDDTASDDTASDDTASADPAAADFTLPERCGASTAHDLVAAGAILGPSVRMRIEAAGVERMSCATVVALISLAQAATKAGGAVVLRAPSNAFTDAFANLGLYESLMNMEFAE